jgi:hypothetical protein
MLCCRVKAEGDETWLMDSRGTDGQGPPVKFETGMGEAPEACLLAARAGCCLCLLPAAAEHQSRRVYGPLRLGRCFQPFVLLTICLACLCAGAGYVCAADAAWRGGCSVLHLALCI